METVPLTAAATTTMGHHAKSPYAGAAVEDKSEELRVVLCGLTLQDEDAETVRSHQPSTFQPAPVLFSEERDELESGYEDDLDATPIRKWPKRGRRRQRIDTAYMPYVKKAPAVRQAAAGDRQRRMAQSARRLAHLHVQAALRHWRATAGIPAEHREGATGVTTDNQPQAAAVAMASVAAEEADALVLALPGSTRALCERIRQQARRKLREERKRLLLARQLVREEARKQAAAAAAAAATEAVGMIPSTEEASLLCQQRMQASSIDDAWRRLQQQEQVGVVVVVEEQGPTLKDIKQEEEEEEKEQRLRLRLKEAAAMVERAQMRVVLRAWHGSAIAITAAAAAAVAAAEQAEQTKRASIAQGLAKLTLSVQRRALRVWQTKVTRIASVEQRRGKATMPPTATGAGGIGGRIERKEQQGGAVGMVWWTGAYVWLREEVARVMAPPRAVADADDYLEVM